MEQKAADARYARLHDDRKWHDGTGTRWANEPSRGFPYRFDFGVTIGVADIDIRPDDLFLTEEAAPFAPLPATDEPDDDQDGPGDAQQQDG